MTYLKNNFSEMIIKDLVTVLENLAHPSLQESYDNVGLITGNPLWKATGIICTLDVTEKVIEEAVAKKCNVVVAHHPIIFSGLKKITGKNYVEKTIIAALKNDIAIYAIHTNLDNVITGVNAKMADALALINRKILAPKQNQLKKLYTYIPTKYTTTLQNALFEIGAGKVGAYEECSFKATGTGSFKATHGTHPFVGKINQRHEETEDKVEFIFPIWLEGQVISTLKKHHPYEQVAYEIISLSNSHQDIGSGLIGELPKMITEKAFLQQLKSAFKLKVIKHTPLLGKKVKTIALCGGAGSFLISNALGAKADFYISADFKYHEFFDANNQLVIADIGHWESEQYTIALIFEHLRQKFPNFAVLKTRVLTNSIQYFV
jgi:dinuclear metal center YbgI/SA1388 family protein